MKFIYTVLLIGSTLFASEAETYFNMSKNNVLLCRVAYDTYIRISQKNASIKTINGTKYFQYKDEPYYFPLSACNIVKK